MEFTPWTHLSVHPENGLESWHSVLGPTVLAALQLDPHGICCFLFCPPGHHKTQYFVFSSISDLV